MIRLDQLDGRGRRRVRRFLRRLADRCGYVHVRREHEYRLVERLHRAGLVTAAISKWAFFSRCGRSFRELAVFTDERDARRMYREILPR